MAFEEEYNFFPNTPNEGMNLNERGKIIVIVGWRGDGKTALLTYLAYLSFLGGRKIYSDYTLHFKGLGPKKNYYTTLSEVAKLPSYLDGADIFLDEIQVAADSRRFFARSNEALNTLVSQLRKRKINLFSTTQIFDKLDKRLRNETDYVVEVVKFREISDKVARVRVRDMRSRFFISERWFYIPAAFGKYDTHEVIKFGEDKEKESQA